MFIRRRVYRHLEMSKIIPFFIIVILLSACSGAPASTPGQEPLGTPASLPTKAACSPPSTWTIQYNRSGGFAGFNESLTLDSSGNLTIKSERPPVDEKKTISNAQAEAISDLLVQACPFETDVEKGNCADCFFYELNIQMDGRTYSVQASDVSLTEEISPLLSELSQLLQDTRQ